MYIYIYIIQRERDIDMYTVLLYVFIYTCTYIPVGETALDGNVHSPTPSTLFRCSACLRAVTKQARGWGLRIWDSSILQIWIVYSYGTCNSLICLYSFVCACERVAEKTLPRRIFPSPTSLGSSGAAREYRHTLRSWACLAAPGRGEPCRIQPEGDPPRKSLAHLPPQRLSLPCSTRPEKILQHSAGRETALSSQDLNVNERKCMLVLSECDSEPPRQKLSHPPPPHLSLSCRTRPERAFQHSARRRPAREKVRRMRKICVPTFRIPNDCPGRLCKSENILHNCETRSVIMVSRLSAVSEQLLGRTVVALVD